MHGYRVVSYVLISHKALYFIGAVFKSHIVIMQGFLQYIFLHAVFEGCIIVKSGSGAHEFLKFRSFCRINRPFSLGILRLFSFSLPYRRFLLFG